MRGRSMLQRSAENKPIYIVRKDHDDIIVQVVGQHSEVGTERSDPDHVTPARDEADERLQYTPFLI